MRLSVRGFTTVEEFTRDNGVVLTEEEFSKLQVLTIARISSGRFSVPFGDLQCIQRGNEESLVESLVRLSGRACLFGEEGELKYLIDELNESITVTKNTLMIESDPMEGIEVVESVLGEFKRKVEMGMNQLQ